MSGLSVGMLLFLVSVGMSLIFGVTRIVNLAHGCFYMVGAYLMVTLVEILPRPAVGVLAGAAPGADRRGRARRRHRDGPAPPHLPSRSAHAAHPHLRPHPRHRHARAARVGPRQQERVATGRARRLGEDLRPALPVLLRAGPRPWRRWWRWRCGSSSIARGGACWSAPPPSIARCWARSGSTWPRSTRRCSCSAAGWPASAARSPRRRWRWRSAWTATSSPPPSSWSSSAGLGSFAGSFIGALLVGLLQSFGILIFPAISIVLLFALMAVVLIVRPWGLLGRPED